MDRTRATTVLVSPVLISTGLTSTGLATLALTMTVRATTVQVMTALITTVRAMTGLTMTVPPMTVVRATRVPIAAVWTRPPRCGAGASGSRRAARGRRGAGATSRAAGELSAKDRLAAKLGVDRAGGPGAAGYGAAGAADYAAGAGPAAGVAMSAGYPGSAAPGDRDFGPRRSGRGRGRAAEMQDGNGRGGQGGNGGHGGGNGRGGPGRPRRKGDWWRRWTWKKALAMCLVSGGAFIILLVVGYFYALSVTPIPVASQFATGQASRVYFRDGTTLVGRFGQSDRQTLQPNQIPAMVRNAMVAAEDKHFYDEGGVSPVGIARAAIADLTSGSVQQGGSTITQQLVRNYYTGIGTAETASRKIKEIFVAEKLAQKESKDWILTNYMNTVPTGQPTCTASARPPRRTSGSRSAS